MNYLFISLLVALVSVAYSAFSSNVLKFHQYENIITSNDEGHADNCGKYNFTLTWSPKVISASKPFTVKFAMMAPMDIDEGSGFIEVWMSGQPIIEYKTDGKCSDIAKVAPGLKCPIKKGSPLVFKRTFPAVRQLPTGNFTFQFNITTSGGDMPFCAKGNIVIVD